MSLRRPTLLVLPVMALVALLGWLIGNGEEAQLSGLASPSQAPMESGDVSSDAALAPALSESMSEERSEAALEVEEPQSLAERRTPCSVDGSLVTSLARRSPAPP